MHSADALGAGGSVFAPDAPPVTDVASATDATHASDLPGDLGGYAAVRASFEDSDPFLADFGSHSASDRRDTTDSDPGSAVAPGVTLLGVPAADVVSVPEAAGREALARLLGYGQPAVAPGPVALSAGGRVLFYVAPGGHEDLPELLDWLDWGGVELDLRASSGPEAADPPVLWLHPSSVPLQAPGGPGSAADRHASHPVGGLPEPPELIALLATLAAACHRVAVTRGGRTPSQRARARGQRPGFAAS